jgi:hypothetical protein
MKMGSGGAGGGKAGATLDSHSEEVFGLRTRCRFGYPQEECGCHRFTKHTAGAGLRERHLRHNAVWARRAGRFSAATRGHSGCHGINRPVLAAGVDDAGRRIHTDLSASAFYTRPPRPQVGQSRCAAHRQTLAVRGPNDQLRASARATRLAAAEPDTGGHA